MAEETTAPAEETQPNADPATDATSDANQLGEAGKKALEAERARAKEAEKRARAAEQELNKLKQQSMSDQERAVAVAEATGWQKAIAEAGKRLARAEIRAQASEKGIDAGAFLEDLDLSRFVGDDGEPDADAIGSAIGRWSQVNPKAPRPAGDIGQGQRGKPPAADPRAAFAALFK